MSAILERIQYVSYFDQHEPPFLPNSILEKGKCCGLVYAWRRSPQIIQNIAIRVSIQPCVSPQKTPICHLDKSFLFIKPIEDCSPTKTYSAMNPVSLEGQTCCHSYTHGPNYSGLLVSEQLFMELWTLTKPHLCVLILGGPRGFTVHQFHDESGVSAVCCTCTCKSCTARYVSYRDSVMKHKDSWYQYRPLVW